MQDFLEIGQIVNTVGLKGFMRVIAFTDDITRFNDLNKVFIILKDKTMKEAIIEEVKYRKNLVILKIKGIDTIEEAEKYKNCYIHIDRKDAIKLEPDTYFIVDLIGLEVFTTENIFIGKIIDVFPNKGNDVYDVRDDFGKQTLIPAIKSVVKNVDLKNKKMIVELIEGM